jgi:hypothetical protein
VNCLNKKTTVAIAIILGVTIGSLATISYFQHQQESTFDLSVHNMIYIQKAEWNDSEGQITVYVHNSGYPQAIKGISINGKLDQQAIPNGAIENNQTREIKLSQTYAKMPQKITYQINATKGSISGILTFLDFKMLGLYWNDSTQKIEAIVSDSGMLSTVNFGKVYINGVLDSGAIISDINDEQIPPKVFKISLSGTYPDKPTKMLLEFFAEGSSFHLESPFNTEMTINLVKWDEKTGLVKFWVYSPYFNLEGRPVSFDEVEVNGILDNSTIINKEYSHTYEIICSTKYSEAPTQLTIRVMTDNGGFGEKQFEWTSNGNYNEIMPQFTNFNQSQILNI